MGRRKTIIVIAVVAALTLAIAGSAYAFTVGDSRGDQDIQPAAAQAAQDDTAQSPTTTSPEGTVGPIQQQDRVQDPASEDCNGSERLRRQRGMRRHLRAVAGAISGSDHHSEQWRGDAQSCRRRSRSGQWNQDPGSDPH